ncbi:branched chain amino acid--2-keto-4-methylthiobutyrate aminotransferase [soil metagenome]|jgi:branched-subunit amino acid aminotransferase/4-amino-4-deoxychorismate lyase
MHNFVGFNHQIIPAETAFLSAVSSAALYGRGIFTTVAIYNSKPFLWEKHFERLIENSQKIGIDLSEFLEETVENQLSEIIKKNNFTRGRARLTFFDESQTSLWQTNSKRKTHLLIQTADFPRIKNNLRLTISPFRVNSTSPLTGVKSCNYLENILALEDAKTKGFDEAIRLNEKGEIVSACLANLFWKKGVGIFTPSLETGCLKGTTREFVLENFTVEERKAELIELKKADEFFLTSAGIGVVKAVVDL